VTLTLPLAGAVQVTVSGSPSTSLALIEVATLAVSSLVVRLSVASAVGASFTGVTVIKKVALERVEPVGVMI
jgi:hypothetical protein